MTQPILSNEQILDRLIAHAGCDNPNQFAAYLSDKYGLTISRQSLNQFKGSTALNLTQALLREALEAPPQP